jgi:chromosomal replication initiation ATPase DnaA
MTDPAIRLQRCFSEPTSRPLALVGPTGSGKTTLLRATLEASGVQGHWMTARDLVERLVAAIREERLEEFRSALASDPRPLVVEHLEDLRERPGARREIEELLRARAERQHPAVLTLTQASGTEGVASWVRACAEVVDTST